MTLPGWLVTLLIVFAAAGLFSVVVAAFMTFVLWLVSSEPVLPYKKGEPE